MQFKPISYYNQEKNTSFSLLHYSKTVFRKVQQKVSFHQQQKKLSEQDWKKIESVPEQGYF